MRAPHTIPAMLHKPLRIAVIAPSSPFDPLRLAQGIETLQAWGHSVWTGPHLHDRHLHFAGTAASRLADLHHALTSPDFDAVWLARGGAGLSHLLAQLPDDLPRDRPVLGFSDGTALHCALLRRGHTQLWHAPVVQQLAAWELQAAPQDLVLDAPSRAWLQTLLERGLTTAGLQQSILPWHHPQLSTPATMQGPVIAGNLTVLASLCGTPWQLDATGAIVVLEDLHEAPYRLDRCIRQLTASGALRGARAVVLGDFLHCKADGYALHDLLAEALAPLGVPVWMGIEVGHGSRNLALRQGAQAILADQTLTWLD